MLDAVPGMLECGLYRRRGDHGRSRQDDRQGLDRGKISCTDQREFGDAWRYELVDGRVVAHAAPTPAHAKIVAALTGALTARMTGEDGCFPELGSGAAPENQQQPNARIPDVMIRCRGLPRVLFEVLSPSELKRWRERDRKRLDEQDIAGVEEIIEIYQSEPAIHIYRRGSGHWVFEPVGGLEAMLELRSVELTIPLAEIYRYIDFDQEEAELDRPLCGPAGHHPRARSAGPDLIATPGTPLRSSASEQLPT